MIKLPLEKIPEKGLVLADFADMTVFEPYEIKNGELCLSSREVFEQQIPIECHFFDDTSELRVVHRGSRNDTIEILLRESDELGMDRELLYTQEVLLKQEYTSRDDMPKKLRIINRFVYSDNDTLILSNYRISLPRHT